MRKEQSRRPLLDARGLRALRWHCITHRHESVIDITKWAQEYFQKPLSVNTIRRIICRCQLKLYDAKSICEHGPEVPSCPVGQGSSKMDCFKVDNFSMVRRVQIWHSCWKLRIQCPPGQRGRRPCSVLLAFSLKASNSDVMGVNKYIRYGQLACFGRHYECWKVYSYAERF